MLVKYKNKDGISLNYTSDDIHTRLVKEVISEAVTMLEDYKVADAVDFLKENFDVVEVEDFMGDTEYGNSR